MRRRICTAKIVLQNEKRRIARQLIDSQIQQRYNEENKVLNEGVESYAERLQQNDRAGSVGNSAQGMAGVQYNDRNDIKRGRQLGEVAVDSGIVRISDVLTKV
jgi:hypothetical protein